MKGLELFRCTGCGGLRRYFKRVASLLDTAKPLVLPEGRECMNCRKRNTNEV